MNYILLGIGILLIIFPCLTALLEANNVPDGKKPRYPKLAMQITLLVGIILIIISYFV